MTPYYEDDAVTLHLGDCREFLPLLPLSASLVTDPPYPNNAGYFLGDVQAAIEMLTARPWPEMLVFWSELERPPVNASLVAVHIWHRSNVNGRPYEPIYHYAASTKRRSEVLRHAAIFDGAGPGCAEYLGHPTQKPVVLMRRLLGLVREPGVIVDPFAGSGSTLRAAKDVGRRAIGIEKDERYCEIAAKRLAQEVLDLGA